MSACNELSFCLLDVNGNAKTSFVVVKRYAVREAKIGQYARGEGVSPSAMLLFDRYIKYVYNAFLGW